MSMSPRISASADSVSELVGGDASAGVLILCDHARNVAPAPWSLDSLSAVDLERHVAWDRGAEALTRGLAERLGVPAVLCGFSRLVIDPNRGESDPTLIMEIADGLRVRENLDLSDSERRRRIEELHRPWRVALERTLSSIEDACDGRPCMAVSIHTFTPTWRGRDRPWHVGVLYDSSSRSGSSSAFEALACLRSALPDVPIGDNQPYRGGLPDDTLDSVAERRGRPNLCFEVRQDLLEDAEGVALWSSRLADAVSSVRFGSSRDYPPLAAPEGVSSSDAVELEAAVTRRLASHLRSRTRTQNLDLMEIGGFCRNCLAEWYLEAASSRGISVGRDAAREVIYGMPYVEWKRRFQTDVSSARSAALETLKREQER